MDEFDEVFDRWAGLDQGTDRSWCGSLGSISGFCDAGRSGFTAYLKNGGTLEKAAMIANHASTRTTQLYDRRSDEVSLDEVERILI